jgi:tRNA pseudouridine38-40 synthase
MVTLALRPEAQAVETATKTRIALVVEYDGTRYHGFQLQGKLPTIQSELEKAIEKLTGETLRVIPASRTDAGVHAKAQVVTFYTASKHSLQTFVRGMNYYLPPDIAIHSANIVGDSFRVRSGAVSREYRYTILNSDARSPLRHRYTYLRAGSMDVEAMDRAARMLIGEHDFASFVNNNEVAAKGTTRRVMLSEVTRQDDTIVFRIIANAFLMHQIRNTIGVLMRVGTGELTHEDFGKILEARKPGAARPTAPASGLCLISVNYRKPIEDYNA